MRIDDQAAAIKLAICDDIGEKAYDFTDVAGILVQMLARIPEVGKLLNITIFAIYSFSHFRAPKMKLKILFFSFRLYNKRGKGSL